MLKSSVVTAAIMLGIMAALFFEADMNSLGTSCSAGGLLLMAICYSYEF